MCAKVLFHSAVYAYKVKNVTLINKLYLQELCQSGFDHLTLRKMFSSFFEFCVLVMEQELGHIYPSLA